MKPEFDLNSYDYHLPEKNIAQIPADKRDQSRLLVLDCRKDSMTHQRFPDLLQYLHPGDLLVVNDTRVFPARLTGAKETGGKVELLLLEYPRIVAASHRDTRGTSPTEGDPAAAWKDAEVMALLKSSRRPRPGSRLMFGDDLVATVTELHENGKVSVVIHFRGELDERLAAHGQMPLPPYIHREHGNRPEDRDRYQTLFARSTGAIAAPTAGLHFSDSVLENLQRAGIATAALTLHVGYGTFAPVREIDIRQHRIHAEYVYISQDTAQQINDTRTSGGRIWAVGTTTARALEFAADAQGHIAATSNWCDLYIYPGYRFKLVKNLLTNFHLPHSSLLFFVAALAGRERIMQSYAEAIRQDYRFYSYGDAMAIIT